MTDNMEPMGEEWREEIKALIRQLENLDNLDIQDVQDGTDAGLIEIHERPVVMETPEGFVYDALFRRVEPVPVAESEEDLLAAASDLELLENVMLSLGAAGVDDPIGFLQENGLWIGED